MDDVLIYLYDIGCILGYYKLSYRRYLVTYY